MIVRFRANVGEDIMRHVRVLSRLHIISELVLTMMVDNDVVESIVSVKRTGVPNQRLEWNDPTTLFGPRLVMCGLFAVYAQHPQTGKIERAQIWMSIEK